MNQSPLLEFESSAFPAEPGEDAQTNPGIFGRSLARWLGERLREEGLDAGDVIAEDFGWCVPVESEPHRLHVACSSGEEPGRWCVFVFTDGGFLSRLLGRERDAQAVATLFAVVRRVLETSPDVRGLCEDPT